MPRRRLGLRRALVGKPGRSNHAAGIAARGALEGGDNGRSLAGPPVSAAPYIAAYFTASDWFPAILLMDSRLISAGENTCRLEGGVDTIALITPAAAP